MTILNKLISCNLLVSAAWAIFIQPNLANGILTEIVDTDNNIEDISVVDGPSALAQASSEQQQEEDAAENEDLEAEESEDTLRIVITATRTEEEITNVPRTVRVIDREEIEQQLEFNPNLNNILGQLLPGFSPPPLRGGARGFTLRGRGVQVLVDGVPQNPNGFVNNELDTFSLESLERI
ncbi:ferric aerobactin receptor [Leptolyngbya sp. Heron Island J]|uniref:TonB-dependent receptor plug domain-containing protein n=1 Tax=Leptolyngbya sp. Heron Island J TaxID=1385935 RepID=UPI0003B96565|nr:Plug domain-containing protein [Leptolyngbya sp. Heron Island J]ESA35329.1 ferric aerobactin receptor [Leptolyngbya sp. Heron Island J]